MRIIEKGTTSELLRMAGGYNVKEPTVFWAVWGRTGTFQHAVLHERSIMLYQLIEQCASVVCVNAFLPSSLNEVDIKRL